MLLERRHSKRNAGAAWRLARNSKALSISLPQKCEQTANSTEDRFEANYRRGRWGSELDCARFREDDIADLSELPGYARILAGRE